MIAVLSNVLCGCVHVGIAWDCVEVRVVAPRNFDVSSCVCVRVSVSVSERERRERERRETTEGPAQSTA